MRFGSTFVDVYLAVSSRKERKVATKWKSVSRWAPVTGHPGMTELSDIWTTISTRKRRVSAAQWALVPDADRVPPKTQGADRSLVRFHFTQSQLTGLLQGAVVNCLPRTHPARWAAPLSMMKIELKETQCLHLDGSVPWFACWSCFSNTRSRSYFS
jgi:hypothetical protein